MTLYLLETFYALTAFFNTVFIEEHREKVLTKGNIVTYYYHIKFVYLLLTLVRVLVINT